ncbi:MAG: DNA-binding response regulator, partial [Actinomycetota bacterium]
MATGGHILVVDDEKAIRRLLRMYLDEGGYTVTEA